ncbi:sulfite reductase [Marivirga lumbricoides]|uniref:Sulfite reductase n=1 Tax=Marivirga lumbricoides TaxID=1046115 RepID=A0A2T4DTC9_9BACT|nr:sulfite reductase [Marivirga lumbricoides]
MSKGKYSVRKFFNDIHLWMGVASGIILFIVCLSGTIYTFRHEVEHALEPEKYEIKKPENSSLLSSNQLIALVEKETSGKVTSISIPADETSSYELSVKSSPEERRGTGYYVNPYTGEILGTQGGAVSDFFLVIMRLHRWLLIEGDAGKIIVGVSTIIFVFLIISGIVIWMPKKWKNWKQGFKIKYNANWKRVNHDLHNTLGFYSAILLLIMALTGLCWSFGWYRDGLSNVIGAKVFGGRGGSAEQVQVPADSTRLPLAALLATANDEFDYEGNYRISIPYNAEEAITIQKSGVGFFASSGSDKIQLNPYNAEIIKIERFADKPFNEKIASSIKPLHTGEIFGLFSKILYFISCLIATSLPVTGIIIWINKLKKKRAAKKKKNKVLVQK